MWTGMSDFLKISKLPQSPFTQTVLPYTTADLRLSSLSSEFN